MKKYIRYYFFAVVAILLVSCTKFLNVTPEKSIPTTSVDPSQSLGLVAGVYSNMGQGEFAGWALQTLLSVRSIDIDGGSTPSDVSAWLTFRDFNYGNFPGFWMNNSAWVAIYDIVNYSNAALEALQGFESSLNSQADKDLNAQYQAEIKVLRTLAWFYGIRMWGVVILNTSGNLQGNLKDPTQPAEAYQFLLDQLNESIPSLPSSGLASLSRQGMVTAFTAKFLKAKIFADMAGNAGNSTTLGQQYWDSILVCTNDIIQSNEFTLYSDYYELFKTPGNLSKESLFELQFSDLGQGSGNQIVIGGWGSTFTSKGPRAGLFPGGVGNPHVGQNISFGGFGWLPPSQTFVDFLNNNGDNKRTTTCIFTINDPDPNPSSATGFIGITPDGDTLRRGPEVTSIYCNGKAYNPSKNITLGRTGYGSNKNLIVFRYADVLLLNAEANLRVIGHTVNGVTANQATADQNLQLVRARVNLPSLGTATIQNICEEKRAEYWDEWGEIFFDFVRTGGYSGPLANSQATGYSAEKQYFPIPQAQIDVNPKLAPYAYTGS